MLERWGKAIRARRFNRTVKSARRCLAVEPKFEFVRVLDTLKHVSAKWDWSAKSHREGRTRDLFACLAIDTTDLSLLRSVYMLCNAFLKSQTIYTYLKFLSRICIAQPLPSSEQSLLLPSSNALSMDNSLSAASCTLELRVMGWFW